MGCAMALTGFYRVQAFLGLIYICLGSAKLLGADIMVEAFDATGLGQSLRVAVGVLEICGGLCLFVPRATIYAAVVLGCTIVGILGAAVGHMVRPGDEQAFGAPRLTITKTWRASAQDGFAAAIWQVPTEVTHRWKRVEG
jgi:DoxX-like family